MVGHVLYPLNMLKGIYPGIYTQEIKKYQGREEVCRRAIPPLNALWGDVVHLAAVEPHKIKEALERAGWDYKPLEYWVIAPSVLSPSNTIVFLYTSAEYRVEDFAVFNPENLAGYSEIPERAVEYYRQCVLEHRKPLFFHLVPHILYRGEIDTEGFSKMRV
jgi:hypothetical protein